MKRSTKQHSLIMNHEFTDGPHFRNMKCRPVRVIDGRNPFANADSSADIDWRLQTFCRRTSTNHRSCGPAQQRLKNRSEERPRRGHPETSQTDLPLMAIRSNASLPKQWPLIEWGIESYCGVEPVADRPECSAAWPVGPSRPRVKLLYHCPKELTVHLCSDVSGRRRSFNRDFDWVFADVTQRRRRRFCALSINVFVWIQQLVRFCMAIVATYIDVFCCCCGRRPGSLRSSIRTKSQNAIDSCRFRLGNRCQVHSRR